MTGIPPVVLKIQSLSTSELIQMTEELQQPFVPLDGLIRIVCTNLYSNIHNKIENVNLGQMTMLMPQIAYELGQRIKNNKL